jgi:DNA end-binding protein Ku
VPGKNAEKSYTLLLKALEETETVGIAEFVLRNREHICALKPYEGALLLNQMRYHDEIRDVPAEAVTKERLREKELDLAVKLVNQLTEKFDPAAFKGTYVTELKRVIKATAAGKNIRIAEPAKKTATVKDLMEVLKQSLNGGKKTA